MNVNKVNFDHKQHICEWTHTRSMILAMYSVHWSSSRESRNSLAVFHMCSTFSSLSSTARVLPHRRFRPGNRYMSATHRTSYTFSWESWKTATEASSAHLTDRCIYEANDHDETRWLGEGGKLSCKTRLCLFKVKETWTDIYQLGQFSGRKKVHEYALKKCALIILKNYI